MNYLIKQFKLPFLIIKCFFKNIGFMHQISMRFMNLIWWESDKYFWNTEK